jgi:hypothetical protein
MAALPPLISQPPRAASTSLDASLPPGWVVDFPGMTLRQLQDAVMRGARFVQFQFCVSVFILSFKRSSPIIFVPAGRSPVSKSWSYSLISLLAGWWGIPWGPFWTLTTFANNISGGKDVSRHVLQSLSMNLPITASPQSQYSSVAAPPAQSQYLSPVEAEARERAESRKTWIARLGWVAAGGVLLGLIALVSLPFVLPMPSRGLPGYIRARDVMQTAGHADEGNTSRASSLAAQMSAFVRDIRATNSAMLLVHSTAANDDVRTFCQIGRTNCAFLIHVPCLARMSAERRDALSAALRSQALTLLNKAEEDVNLGVLLHESYEDWLLTSRDKSPNTSPGSWRGAAALQKQLLPWFVPEQSTGH